ncbi:acyltransferase family protein [Lacticaseibacillus hulanensis]|uniref:acyltransferase family protein n=1 Tax=Lacticaseibacillus hulanensis TaxID=2493111 RepID=UPI003BAAF4E7
MDIKTENSHSRNGTIDILRVVFALLIIMIHYNGGEKLLSILANTVGRLGVPFFFLVSGFFFFRKKYRQKTFSISEIWKFSRKTFFLWLICSIFLSYHPFFVNSPKNVFLNCFVVCGA